MRIHLIFHYYLLDFECPQWPLHFSSLSIPMISVGTEKKFEVQCNLDFWCRRIMLEFLIHGKDYPDMDRSQEAVKKIRMCPSFSTIFICNTHKSPGLLTLLQIYQNCFQIFAGGIIGFGLPREPAIQYMSSYLFSSREWGFWPWENYQTWS